MATPQVLPRKHRTATLAEQEVEVLNHCFNDVELFMCQLQRAAEAQNVLEQKTKKKKKPKKKKKKEYDLMIEKESPPSEEDFVDIFQKIKYSFILLDRLKMAIAEPNSEELLHCLFVPLGLMVKTTGGPAVAAGVSSPALTSSAIYLLQQNVTPEERELWSSLGPNWTQPHDSAPVYRPVFQDGWQPDTQDQRSEDPAESQHRYERAFSIPDADHADGSVSVNAGQWYYCSYDFVARNSSELSVLHGETLQVLESSNRWWKCRNTYDEIGFVPSNILEPLNHTETDSGVELHNQPKKVALSPTGGGRFSYAEPSAIARSHTFREIRPASMPPIGNDGVKVMHMDNDIGQHLANGKQGSSRRLVINRTSETSAPLNYNSPPTEVQGWLQGKGFSDVTVNNLGILSGAQLLSLNRGELCTVSPQEGARVYSQIMVQKAMLEKMKKSSELENVMKKQKMKMDLNTDAGEF